MYAEAQEFVAHFFRRNARVAAAHAVYALSSEQNGNRLFEVFAVYEFVSGVQGGSHVVHYIKREIARVARVFGVALRKQHSEL